MKKQQQIYRGFLFAPLCTLLLTPFLSLPAQAGSYTESAHGDKSFGVKRNAPDLNEYAQGNCAHCHEQHASINGIEPYPFSGADAASPFLLFEDNLNTSSTTSPYLQSDNFCFNCHTYVSSMQSGGIINRDYAATFGGYTTNSPLGVFEAFNQQSYHNLSDIQDFSKDTFTDFFTATSNPCVACHNPHKAKQNKEHQSNSSFSAVSRPADHDHLWGDDAKERMKYASNNDYMAPYYATSGQEPGGITSGNDTAAAATPDYNTFCTDCHNRTNIIRSTSLGRNLRTIDWDSEGGDGDAIGASDKHGKGDATKSSSRRAAPYYDENNSAKNDKKWVLSCLDCHEPHGSPNDYLIRREVNGDALGGLALTAEHSSKGNSTFGLLCLRCHTRPQTSWEQYHHQLAGWYCFTCHIETYNDKAALEIVTPGCEECHAHGGFVQDKKDSSLRFRTF